VRQTLIPAVIVASEEVVEWAQAIVAEALLDRAGDDMLDVGMHTETGGHGAAGTREASRLSLSI
jgi:hypothetical protein